MAVDKALALLRQAIFAAPPDGCGWTYEALELATGKDRSYLHRVLNGGARCTLEFLASLPRDARARHACLVAEQYSYVVVQPASVDTSAAHLVAGLLGLLRPTMAKASLDRDVKEGAA
jgi:hypothetical protein